MIPAYKRGGGFDTPLLKAQNDVYRAQAIYLVASNNLYFARVHDFNIKKHERDVCESLDMWRRSILRLDTLKKLRGLT